MTDAKPSRTVTHRRCASCTNRFAARRSDARYCSGRCRQRAARGRADLADLDREIEAARLRYWELVRRREAAGSGSDASWARSVDLDGTVSIDGKVVGRTTSDRPGWAAWGIEAAGPPFMPPPQTPERR